MKRIILVCFILIFTVTFSFADDARLRSDYVGYPVEFTYTQADVVFGFSSKPVTSTITPGVDDGLIDNSADKPLVLKYDEKTARFISDYIFFFIQVFTSSPITVSIENFPSFSATGATDVPYTYELMTSGGEITGKSNETYRAVTIFDEGFTPFSYPRVYSFRGRFYVDATQDIEELAKYTTQINIKVQENS